MLTRSFKIGMNAGHIVTPVIHVNQYDHDEQWIFTLVDDNGVVYTPSTGGIVGLKADGNVILNAGTVNSSGQVVINETQQMTAAVGDATYELLLDNSTHGCANFTVRVEPKPGDNASMSASDLSLLQEAIDSTIPANIADAVQDWMDDNLAPSQWVLDSTLTLNNAAANAKSAGDKITELKTAIETYTGNVAGVYVKNKYFPLGGDTTDPLNPTDTTAHVECCMIPVTSDEYVQLTATGAGNNTRAWAFVTTDGTILQKAPNANGYTYKDVVLKAPSNTAYFVSNNSYDAIDKCYVIKNKNVGSIAENNSNFIDDLLTTVYGAEALTINAYIKSNTGEQVSSSIWKATDFINVSDYSVLKTITPTFGQAVSGDAGIAFYDDNKTYVSGIIAKSTGLNSYEEQVISIPVNVKYVRFTIRTADASHFYIKGAVKTETVSANLAIGMQMFERIGVISDSISCGWALDKNGNRSRRNLGVSWVQQMARRLGCTAYNLGASGVDPIEWFQTNYEFYQYCLPQYQSVGACDLYIIGLGLNQGTLGTINDINQADYTQNESTFYGQYARIIQMINAEHPNAIVMCLTEPTTAISAYDDAVRNICNLSFINAELVDLENDYFDLFNTSEILSQHQPDGLHYTPYGYSLIAEAMMEALNDYISKNATVFKYVGVATV